MSLLEIPVENQSSSLSPKQQHFVDAYSLDRNASRAARAAGYSKVSAKVIASRLLTKVNILDALADKEKLMQRDLDMTRDRVINELREAVEAAKLQNDPGAMVAGLREIGRMCGYYAPERKVITVGDTAESAQLRSLSDEELTRIIKG